MRSETKWTSLWKLSRYNTHRSDAHVILSLKEMRDGKVSLFGNLLCPCLVFLFSLWLLATLSSLFCLFFLSYLLVSYWILDHVCFALLNKEFLSSISQDWLSRSCAGAAYMVSILNLQQAGWLAGGSRLCSGCCVSTRYVPSSHTDWSIAAWSGEVSDPQGHLWPLRTASKCKESLAVPCTAAYHSVRALIYTATAYPVSPSESAGLASGQFLLHGFCSLVACFIQEWKTTTCCSISVVQNIFLFYLSFFPSPRKPDASTGRFRLPGSPGQWWESLRVWNHHVWVSSGSTALKVYLSILWIWLCRWNANHRCHGNRYS